ncbi:MAG: hypothetical protein J5748_06970, partial [Bacteroidales bacterium]|nr:hypothetical protein [Bacteroidales bacterium]
HIGGNENASVVWSYHYFYGTDSIKIGVIVYISEGYTRSHQPKMSIIPVALFSCVAGKSLKIREILKLGSGICGVEF